MSAPAPVRRNIVDLSDDVLPSIAASRIINQEHRDSYECYCCNLIVRNAFGFTGSSGCGHFLCSECFSRQQSTTHSSTCTICRHGEEAVDISSMVSQQLARVKVECDNEGCSDSFDLLLKFKGVAQHNAVCAHFVVKCPSSLCGARVPRKNLASHVAFCNKAETKCATCAEVMPASDILEHLTPDNNLPCRGFVPCPNKCTLRDNKYNIPEPASKRQVGSNREPTDPLCHFFRADLVKHRSKCPRNIVQCGQCDETFLAKDEEEHQAKAVLKHMASMSRQLAELKKETKNSGFVLGHRFQNKAMEKITDFFTNLDNDLSWRHDITFEPEGARPRVTLSLMRTKGTGGNSFTNANLRVLNFRTYRAEDDVGGLNTGVTEQTYGLRIVLAQMVDGEHNTDTPLNWDLHVAQSTRSVSQRSWSSLSLEHFVEGPIVLDHHRRFCIGVELLW